MSSIEKIKKKIREGCGQGNGANYKPWLTIQDFPSYGQCNREVGHTTGRQHELMSLLERSYFLILEWCLGVIDIREQFPLLSHNRLSPLEETEAIAKLCGIKHPPRNSNEPEALTTDFFITLARPIGTITLARTVKPSGELAKKRVIEKFEIERRYWRGRAVNWGIVTEHQINMIFVKNIEWVHPYMTVSSLFPQTEDKVVQVARALTGMVSENNRSLSDIALDCDDRIGLELGRSLAVARYLIGSRQWHVDMTKPIHPEKPLNLLRVAFAESTRKKASGE